MSAAHQGCGQQEGIAYGDGANEEAPRRKVQVLRRRMLLPMSAVAVTLYRATALYQLLRRERLGRQVCYLSLLVPCLRRLREVGHWASDVAVSLRRGDPSG